MLIRELTTKSTSSLVSYLYVTLSLFGSIMDTK